MKYVNTLMGVFFFAAYMVLFTTNATAQSKPAQNAKYTEFNFWIGEWDVYKFGTDTIVGDSKIESILGGMVIKESYKSLNSPYKGTSLNKYNPQSGQWEQYWVDNSGLTLHIIGDFQHGKMVLGNEVVSEKGTLNNRITWFQNKDMTVRQIWEQSTDGGANWVTAFDGLYKSKK